MKIKIPRITILVALFIGLSIGIVYVGLSWASVGVGTAMIRVSQIQGYVSEPLVGPASGFFFNGFFRLIGQEYPIYIECQRSEANTLGMWGDGTDPYADYPSVACFSKDQLEMNIDIYLRWELDVNKLVQLYRNYPSLNHKNVIASIAREQMRIITSTRYPAVMTIENRDKVREEMMNAIIEKIGAEPSLVGALMNVEFELRNIGYPEEYTKSIEAKMAAEQGMKQAEYDAQKIVVLAGANAQQVLISAQAAADAKIIDAQGIQESIRLISNATGVPESEITKLYLWLNTLQQIEAPTFIMFLGEDGIPVLIPVQP